MVTIRMKMVFFFLSLFVLGLLFFFVFSSFIFLFPFVFFLSLYKTVTPTQPQILSLTQPQLLVKAISPKYKNSKTKISNNPL